MNTDTEYIKYQDVVSADGVHYRFYYAHKQLPPNFTIHPDSYQDEVDPKDVELDESLRAGANWKLAGKIKQGAADMRRVTNLLSGIRLGHDYSIQEIKEAYRYDYGRYEIERPLPFDRFCKDIKVLARELERFDKWMSQMSLVTDSTKLCYVCNQPISGKRADSDYCSDKCRQRAYRNRRNTNVTDRQAVTA